MFKFKALILSVFSFKTSWAKSPNLLIFKIMSAAMTKWHLFRGCNKNMHYLALGSVLWQCLHLNVQIECTNAPSALLNGCGSASNPTEWCLINTVCCFCSSEKCFVGLCWFEECEAFFQKQGGATLGFFPISRTWRLENCMAKAPAIAPCHSLCALGVSETLCCCS